MASTPVCTSDSIHERNLLVKENQKFEMSCNLSYSGNWAPVMKWQQDGGPVITHERVVNNTVPYKSATYSLTVRATRDMNGFKF